MQVELVLFVGLQLGEVTSNIVELTTISNDTGESLNPHIWLKNFNAYTQYP